jgi:hypothetical protein
LGVLVLLAVVVEVVVVEVFAPLVCVLPLASLRVELTVRQRKSTPIRLHDVGDEDATLYMRVVCRKGRKTIRPRTVANSAPPALMLFAELSSGSAKLTPQLAPLGATYRGNDDSVVVYVYTSMYYDQTRSA